MTRKIAPFGLRLPGPLRQMLEQLAKNNRRSLNAEMITRLEQSVEFAKRYPYVDKMRVGDNSPELPRAAEQDADYRDADIERSLADVLRQLTLAQKRALLLLLKR